MDATSGGVITSYSIDGASSSNVTTQAGLGDTYHQQFWSSEQFPVAVQWVQQVLIDNHVHLLASRLRVTMVKVNNVTQSGEGTIWFDYFLVRDPTVVTYPTTSSAPLTPTTSPISNSRQSTPIGSIVGGALGGLSLLLVAIFLLVLYRRGHTKLSPKKIYNSQSNHDFEIISGKLTLGNLQRCHPVTSAPRTHLSNHIYSAIGRYPKMLRLRRLYPPWWCLENIRLPT